jgi:hypothetical protein
MGGGWSAPRTGRFTPGKDPVPIVKEKRSELNLLLSHYFSKQFLPRLRRYSYLLTSLSNPCRQLPCPVPSAPVSQLFPLPDLGRQAFASLLDTVFTNRCHIFLCDNESREAKGNESRTTCRTLLVFS